MRAIYLLIMALALNANAYAADFFLDKSFKEIFVVEISDEVALLRTSDGTSEEVMVGDIIGDQSGEVLEIKPDYIIVGHDNTRTMLPLILYDNENPGIR
jgi:hypothetical protein